MTDPVLTSSWCTAWGSYNTPRLWSMVKDEDDPEAWRQVAAWGAVSGALADQRSLLLNAREALAAAWPPEQNRSAAAFVAEVDNLIAQMDRAKTEADDTATGLANILEALRQAKHHIQPLWERYQQKSDDLVPAWWDKAEDQLDKQAQAHMITAEQIVQDNVARLRVPDPYVLEPANPLWDPKPVREPDGSGSSDAGGAGAAAGDRIGGGVSVPVPHDPVPPLPGREATVPDGVSGVDPAAGGPAGGPAGTSPGSGVGPGLAGVINPPVPPPSGPPPTVTPPIGAPPGGPGVLPPIGGLGTGGPRIVRPGGLRGDAGGQRYDPDGPWEVGEGVDPVTGTAVDRGEPGRDDYYGAGQLDLMAALTAPQPAASSAAPVTGAPVAIPAAPTTGDDDGGPGIPPVVIMAAGLLLLAGAGLAGALLLARSRRAGG